MKKPLTLLLLLLASVFLQARDLPKINLRTGEKYMLETVYHEDSTRAVPINRYDKKKFEIEVIAFNEREKSYDISLVITYFLHVVQIQKDQEWKEDEVYETGTLTTYRSPLVYLNMFRVPVQFKLSENGKVSSFQPVDFGKNKTPEGFPIGIGEQDQKSLKQEISALFFDPEKTRSFWDHQMDVRSRYKIIHRDESVTEVLVTKPDKAIPEVPSSYDQFHRKVIIDNATGLIVQDKLSFVWQFTDLRLLSYPSQYSRSDRYIAKPYNKFISRHQRLIAASSKPFEVMQRTGLSTYENVQIQNPNTTLRIVAPDSAGYSRYLYLTYWDQRENSLKTFRLERDEDGSFNFKQHFTGPQRIYLRPAPLMPEHMVEEDLYLSPGDDLKVKIRKHGDSIFYTFHGTGADENRVLQKLGRTNLRRLLSGASKQSLTPLKDSILQSLDNEKQTLHPDFILDMRNTLTYAFHLAGENMADTAQKYQIPVVNTLAEKNILYMYFLHRYVYSFIQKAKSFSSNYRGTVLDNEKYYSFAQVLLPEPVLSEFLAFEVEMAFSYGKWDKANLLYERHRLSYSNSERFKQTEQIYRQNELLAPGRPFPVQSLTDINGERIDLAGIKDKLMIVMVGNLRTVRQGSDRPVLQLWDNYKSQYADLLQDIVPVQILLGNRDEFEKIKPSLDTTAGVRYILMSSEELRWAYGQPINLTTNDAFVLGRKGTILFDQAPGYTDLKNALMSLKNPSLGDRNYESALKTIVIILLSIIFSIGLTFLLYRQITKRRLRKAELTQKMRELELSVIRTQMNPHFMYNCLNSIQNLLYKNQNDEAHLYLSRFASLVRQVLNNSKKSEIPLSKELDSVKEYIGLEQLRFNFDFKLEKADEIDADNIFVPPMLLQPFVENAILHGLSAKKADRKLEIRIFRDRNRVELIVEDNGVGRQAAAKSEGNGQGILLSQNRLALLTEKTGIRYDLQITDLSDGNGDPCGTRVSISFTEED